MPFIQLTGGAYQNRSLIAAAQRCLNLFPEITPQEAGEPIRVTHYCTPGLTLQAAAPVSAFDNGCRGLYTASTGNLYAVYDQTVYLFGSDSLWTKLGTFQPSDPSDATARDNPVSMSDNGFVLLIADGSVDGYFVDITKAVSQQTLTRINRGINTGWYGADNISFQDTFFLMNQPGTTKWYISLSNITATNLTAAYSVFTATIATAGSGYSANDVLTLNSTGGAQITVNSVDASGAITGYGVTNGGALNTPYTYTIGVTGGTGTGASFSLTYETNPGGFDPLDFVGMEAQVTHCVAAVSAHRVVWVLGSTAYEIWVNSGGTGTSAGSFPFTIYPVGFANFGVAAKYSIATIMNKIFWVSSDKFGHGLIMMGDALTARRISTHAIEFEIAQYPSIDDAIAFTYQQMGHAFYVVSFPSANNDRGATWVYDESTNEWHERCYIDSNGIEYKHLGIAAAGAYGNVYVGDWRNGNLYTFDLDNYTDNGSPIKRLRSFPHQIDLEANRRVMYHQLIAQMQVGSGVSASSEVQTLLDCEFDAADNTLLQNYHNINSFGATFTPVTPTNAIILKDAVIGQVAGDVLYQVAGTPTTPDYTIRYTVQPTEYTAVVAAGNIISIIGRGVPYQTITPNGLVTTYVGYTASIYSDGTQYYVSLETGASSPMWLPIGTISSGSWEIYLGMQSTSITVSVYRTEDGTWLNSGSVWVPSKTSAIAITDSTYSQPGVILLGGNWGGADIMVGIDPSVSASAQIGTLTVSMGTAVMLNLIGVQTNSATGTFVFDQTQEVALIGIETDSAIGALSISNDGDIAFGLAGVASSAQTGIPTASESVSTTLTGVVSNAGIGALTTFTGVLTLLTGNQAVAQRGTLTTSRVQSVSVHATGVAATFGTGSPGTALPSQAPSQAANAGYTSLVFFDDFTNANTITLTNQTGVQRSQFKWFPASWGGNVTSPTNVQVNTTWHAGDSNMQAQGVSPTSPTLNNASSNGGIVRLQGGASNATLITIDGWATTLPTQGVWNTGYFEAYIQYQAANVTEANSADGWPAWWSWSVQNVQGLGFGGSTFSGPYTEIDFWEYAVASNGLHWGGGAFHGSMGGGPYSYNTPGVTVDSNWHTIGCLWTPTSVDFYYDNVHVGSSTTPSATLNADQQFLMLGSGLNLTGPFAVPIYVDWVKVWQAPQVPNFSVKNGNIIDPHGNAWTAHGINVLDNDIPNVSLSLINTLFANGINCIRLACGGDDAGFLSAQPNSVIQNWVNQVTNNGQGPIVVMIENHDPSQQAAYTGSLLAQEQAWYKALAQIFATNPYVWFASMNEPSEPNVSAQHLATYNTIRSVSNTMVGFCITDGDDYPDNASVYANMYSCFFDIHFYNWMTYSGSSTCPAASNPTNQTSVDASLTTYIQNLNAFATCRDGPMVVMVMECGFIDYAHDQNVDAHGGNGTNQVVIAALTTGQTVGRGACIWLWAGLYTFGNSVTDCVDQSGNTLTDHGTVVKNNL